MPNTIIAALGEPDEATPYAYTGPYHKMDKSFILSKGGFRIHLPISRCPVKDISSTHITIEVPDWLYNKHQSFFN